MANPGINISRRHPGQGRWGSARLRLSDVRLIAVITACALAALMACAQKVPSHARSGRSGSGSVAAGSSVTTAAPRPGIEIFSPPPNTWVNGSDIVVEGKVSDPTATGIVGFEINHQPVALAPDGSFRQRIILSVGINTITARAEATDGSRGYSHVSYMTGPVRPADDPVSDALLARINPQILPHVRAALVEQLRGVDVNANLQALNPIMASSWLFGVVSVRIDLRSLTFTNPDANLDLFNGGLAFNVTLRDLRIDFDVQDQGGFTIPFSSSGTITADSLLVASSASLTAGRNGSLNSSFSPATVQFTNFQISLSSVPSFIVNLVKGSIRTKIEGEISDMFNTRIPQLVDDKLSKVGQPQTLTLLGKNLTWQLSANTVNIDSSGIEFALDLGLSSTPDPTMPLLPGCPTSPSSAPILGMAKGFLASINDDTVNAVLFHAWRSGLMNVDLDSSTLASTGSALSLDFSTFAHLLPELSHLVAPNAPMVIKVRPKLPPFFGRSSGFAPFALSMGGTRIEIYNDLGGGQLQLLVALTLHAWAEFDVTMSNGAVAITAGPVRPRLLFNVDESPLARLDETRLQALLSLVVDSMLPTSAVATRQIQIPSFAGLEVQNLELTADGPRGDYLTISGNLIKR